MFDIANAFFRVGYVESWGRGITKMKFECEKADLPIPTYKYEASEFWVEFRKDIITAVEEWSSTAMKQQYRILSILESKEL